MELKDAEIKLEHSKKKNAKAALKLKSNVYNPILDDLSGSKDIGGYFNRP
jgi:hypothetical protein